MTPTEVRTLARLGESSTLEFKRDLRDATVAVKVLTAFANTAGGTLLVGVDDDGSVVGVRDATRLQATIDRAAQSAAPPLRVAIERINVDNKDIVIAQVDKAGGLHLVDGEILRRIGTQTRALPVPPVALDAAVVDGDPTTAAVLKAILQQEGRAKSSEIFTAAQLNILRRALSEKRFNCVFIDPFTIGVEQATEFIGQIREDFPIVSFCLYARSTNLASLPGVDDQWRTRLGHYYQLPKDRSFDALAWQVDETLYRLAEYVQDAIARTKITHLRTELQSERLSDLSKETKRKVEEVADAAEKALQRRSSGADKMSALVPAMQADGLEQLVTTTLERASRALSTTSTVNIAVLVFGALVVVGAIAVAVWTERWQAVAFGGFGMAGMIASLITNPLKSIGSSARKLVQVQVAYFTFLKQLQMLSQDSGSGTAIERSRQLGEEMARTLKALEDHFGDK